ncbi:hypothetical protein OH76DRAFT_468426 [Lentinus brumalis]|uniref:Uncharacterized protein n=1 Tax=Lentinus brumalis TaxID=2498619 RepID=A0A371DCR0_9APHY|nr:hypothetical protein OH76DRAFT_468426 [Polyporus brumalis]
MGEGVIRRSPVRIASEVDSYTGRMPSARWEVMGAALGERASARERAQGLRGRYRRALARALSESVRSWREDADEWPARATFPLRTARDRGATTSSTTGPFWPHDRPGPWRKWFSDAARCSKPRTSVGVMFHYDRQGLVLSLCARAIWTSRFKRHASRPGELRVRVDVVSDRSRDQNPTPLRPKRPRKMDAKRDGWEDVGLHIRLGVESGLRSYYGSLAHR